MTPADRSNGRSLRAMARWAGALNALSAVPDGFAVNTLSKLAVRGDVAATAHNILGSERLFRLSIVADLVGLLMFIASAVLLYEIFKPASRQAALLFLVLILMGSLVQSLNCVQDLAALALFKGGPSLSALPSAQANALGMVFLRLNSFDFYLALFFDGCSSLVMAYLVLRSTFVPRVLGPLMVIDGLGFLTFSITSLVSPPLAAHLYPIIPFATACVGSLMLFLWLMIMSVNVERWREQAAASDWAATA